ncbi:siderophore-interacting protein [Nesterenkonia sp. MY13]|uniref:Siderophore-interacting protein n=1 Tax=Nesterenkonia sedimenti TaxID=1463632 RepID=A0A7X8YEB3_9MICC|nr:siderophore-interacting protein [Nesterenkonia sedimenti]NLS10643.1 siderophore-interacting protein [Nesterenkonia sedimenti]
MSSETPAPAQKPAKPRQPRVQRMLTVVETHRITPHMVRVILGGEQFDDIEFKTDTDQYIKLLFADPDLGLQRPYDLEALREQLPAEQMPVTRTYTIRYIDWKKKQIWVDFVVHGDEGIAGPWAANAQPGDLLSFFGPGSGYSPREEADFHLIAGDESALPAIAAGLEGMSPTAKGIALVEVRDADEEQQFDVPAGIELRWLHRGADFSPDTTQLAEELKSVDLPKGDVQVFIHGEREQMKAIRRDLVQERGLERRGMSLSAYWAHGRREDAFQAEKKLPIGKID